MNPPIYLDNAAATPLDERVFVAMQPYFKERFYNPSAAYAVARSVRDELDDAKQLLARNIGAKRDELILTAGATESINLAFNGILSPGDKVVIGATEHEAVRAVAGQFDVTIAACDEMGLVHPEAVLKAITDQTQFVSITGADSELGSIQPLAKIASALEKVREDRRSRGVTTPLYFHTDASQAAGTIDLHVARLGVNLLTLNAAKCYGPKQVGLLWVDSRIPLRPFILGGGQERGLRAGTENVAGAVGFAVALSRSQDKRHSESKRQSQLRDRFESELSAAFPELIVNGSRKKRLPGHSNVSIDGLDAERVVFHLDTVGVLVATGAACAANKGTRSKVLQAIGRTDSQVDGSLRFSLGRYTTADDIKKAIPLIIKAIKTEKAL